MLPNDDTKRRTLVMTSIPSRTRPKTTCLPESQISALHDYRRMKEYEGLTVEPARDDGADEELRSVRVLSGAVREDKG